MMPIPPPEVAPDKYDFEDCRPGPSKYPAANAAELDRVLYEMLMNDPELRDLAERVRPRREQG